MNNPARWPGKSLIIFSSLDKSGSVDEHFRVRRNGRGSNCVHKLAYHVHR